ncbi:MAG TPA: ComEC/Rec2 family competence protein, partial [bacterium]|nr:ComEC/Rec2 family competence protein [bacterium]
MNEDGSTTAFPFRRPAFLACLAFLGGLVCGRAWDPSATLLLSGCLFLAVLLCAAFRYGVRDSFPALLPLFLLLTFLLGIMRFEWHQDNWRDFQNETSLYSRQGTQTLHGTVNGAVEGTGSYSQTSFPIKDVSIVVEKQEYPVGSSILVTAYCPLEATPQFGDVIQCVGLLEPIRAVALPGQVDNKAYLASEGIHGRVRIYEPSQLRLIRAEHKSPYVHMRRAIFSLRQAILKTYRQRLPA